MQDTGRRGAHEVDRGNAGPWTPRKTKSRFSPGAHSPWKSLRDSHIPTVATKQWKWKTKNRFSHFPLPRVGSSDQIQKGGLAAELRSSSRLIVRLENAAPHNCWKGRPPSFQVIDSTTPSLHKRCD